jgi:hypothetical protein
MKDERRKMKYEKIVEMEIDLRRMSKKVEKSRRHEEKHEDN